MEDLHAFRINLPIPKVYAKVSTKKFKETELQRRLKNAMKKPRKYSPDLLKMYALPPKHPLRTEIIKKDEVLLPYRLYAKEQEKYKHRHHMNITIREKYKMTVSEYRSRLHVEDPLNDVKAVTDIDKDFFNYASGRHIIDRAPIYKTLKTVLTNQLRTKLEVGFRNDHILNMDTNHRNEINNYVKTLKMFTKQTKYLDKFISEDYRKSIALIRKCDELQNKLYMEIVELQHLADQRFRIVSNLIGLDYMYYLQQRYGRFLYYLSPPSWRASNRKFAQSMEIEVKGFDLGGGGDKTFNDIFDKMQKECLGDLVSPAMYFTKPHELIRLFEYFENQLLNYLEYVTFLAPHIKHAKELINLLKFKIDQEGASVLNTVKTFETLLQFSEERCAHLENKFHKIANGFFYENTGAPEVIKLTLHVEFVYEELYSEKPMNMDIFSMVKSLESFYMYYCKRFDSLLSDTIKEAVKESVEMEHTKFRRARQARRDLCVFDSLKKSLMAAFSSPTPKSCYHKETEDQNLPKKTVPSKLKPIVANKQNNKITTKNKSLTDSELEYLALFTNWSHDEDPDNYLHKE